MGQRRQFSKDFKLKVLAEVQSGKSVAEVARKYEILPNQIHLWKNTLAQHGDNAFKGNGNTYTQEARIAELERTIGQLTVENNLLKKAISTFSQRN